MAKLEIDDNIVKVMENPKSLKLCLVIIEERDSDGIPLKLRLVREDETVDLKVHNDFMRVWVDPKMLEKSN